MASDLLVRVHGGILSYSSLLADTSRVQVGRQPSELRVHCERRTGGALDSGQSGHRASQETLDLTITPKAEHSEMVCTLGDGDGD